jgi:hypothetical protein
MVEAHRLQDHWVSNHIRDELIAARGEGEDKASSSKPLMLIDDNEVPHSFCIGKLSYSWRLKKTYFCQNTANRSQKRSTCG